MELFIYVGAAGVWWSNWGWRGERKMNSACLVVFQACTVHFPRSVELTPGLRQFGQRKTAQRAGAVPATSPPIAEPVDLGALAPSETDAVGPNRSSPGLWPQELAINERNINFVLDVSHPELYCCAHTKNRGAEDEHDQSYRDNTTEQLL